MKNVLVVVYDEVAKTWSSPLMFVNMDCAKRYFNQLMSKNECPTDFRLYQLGEIDVNAPVLEKVFDLNLNFICVGEKKVGE